MPRHPLIVLLVGSLLLVGTAFAADSGKTLLNLDKQGVAIQGYDPVAYFTDGKPVKGSADFTSSHQGATYRFASAEHQALFDADPAKYVPAFGGYCAYGVAKGKLFKIDPKAFDIVDGRLILQYDKGVARKFAKDTEGHMKKADANWPKLLAAHGE